MLEWNESCRVGNGTIDEQHEEWVKLFNKLEQLLLSGDIDGGNRQLEILNEIIDFTYNHFHYEEELMSESNYPHFSRHHRMHKDFHQKLYEMYRNASDGDIVLTSELLSMVRNWFVSHTQQEDRKFFNFINS